jgi:hypothetical protein
MNAAELQVNDIIRYRAAGQRKARVAIIETLFAAGEVEAHAVAIVNVAGEGRCRLHLTSNLQLITVTR